MSAVTCDIERLSIVLHGVSGQVAQAAVADLAQELRRRIAGFTLQDWPDAPLGLITIGPITGESVLDAAALRVLIAERLVDAIFQGRSPASLEPEIQNRER
jgi:hypothetical protein